VASRFSPDRRVPTARGGPLAPNPPCNQHLRCSKVPCGHRGVLRLRRVQVPLAGSYNPRSRDSFSPNPPATQHHPVVQQGRRVKNRAGVSCRGRPGPARRLYNSALA